MWRGITLLSSDSCSTGRRIHCRKLNRVKKIPTSGMAEVKTITKDPKLLPGFTIREKRGDLFSCPETDSLAHCISADVRMGAGIAVAFRKKFGMVDVIRKQKKGPGEVAVLKKDVRFIYNLVTKVKYNNKPTYTTVKNSLIAVKAHSQEHSVKSISMPRIGSGLDKLEWSRVKEIISEVFKDTELSITVYYF